MKTILFLRHGKSDLLSDFSLDHERPLAERGIQAARAVGAFLRETGHIPARVLTSSALRARQTLAEVRAGGSWPHVDTVVDDGLYESSPEHVLRVLRGQPDEVDSLLLVGHEPTWSGTVSRLIGGGTVRYPTAALARVDLDVHRWQAVQFGAGRLIWFVPPKLLTGGLSL